VTGPLASLSWRTTSKRAAGMALSLDAASD
jgi:hypothetical protein